MKSYQTVIVGFFFILLTPSVFWAQTPVVPPASKNYKQLVRLAERMIKDGYFTEAAAQLEAAYQLKPQKTDLAYQSALLYLNSREYRKAVTLFRPIANDKKFPDIHLEFAQALQRSGEWDEAVPEFLLYLNSYKGKDSAHVSEKVEDYISGCSLGIRQSDSSKISPILVEHLNENINTTENDIAPVPFGDDVLYFTTRWHDAAKILRTRQIGDEWTPSEKLTSLPIPASTQIGNGAFSPDGNRFYCTMCQETGKKKQKSCGIYFLKRKNDGWTAPEKLSERINQGNSDEGDMTTQPFVMYKGNNEILFFSSNRKGGYGGMDIWMTSRSRTNENSVFESPFNLGAIINTEGDEVTPFYDDEEQTLYFASNGRATLGGLDIFKSQGSGQRWTSPANVGAPYNSGADDWYFVKNKSKTGGFFVSNRAFGMEKISSHDDDIFKFTINDRPELLVSGRVFDKNNKMLLENVRLSLYEQKANTDINLRLLSSVICAEGSYQFAILPQKTYILEVEKDGFRIGNALFSTKDSVKNGTRDFYLERYTAFVSDKIFVEETVKTPQKAPISPKTNKEIVLVAPEKTKIQKAETTTPTKPTLPKTKQTEEAVQFKVQIMAYQNDIENVNLKKLKRVEDLGNLETENATINGKHFTRVMLSFNTYDAASKALKEIKERSLGDAFIMRYENGKRTGKSR